MAPAGRPSKQPRTEFGQHLYDLRKESGLTQKEVADALGVSPSFVTFWERKGKSLPPHLLLKLSELYDVSVDFLVGKEKGFQKTAKVSGRLRKCFKKASHLSRRQQDKIAEVVEALVLAHEK